MNIVAPVIAESFPSLVWRAGKRHIESLVYFVLNSSSGAVKIGWTIDLGHRLTALKNGAGTDLHVIRTIEGGRAKERWLHKKFADRRTKGEWFKYHADMLVVVPPDEIIRPQKIVRRRDIRLSVRERLRDAEKMGREIGLSDRLVLTTFITSLNDEEARALLDLVMA
jgi:hypothetical protein